MTDISVLMSAVKPRDRTDQYVVLSALFALEAHVASVTAKQITDLLKLHLGAKAPHNVRGNQRGQTP